MPSSCYLLGTAETSCSRVSAEMSSRFTSSPPSSAITLSSSRCLEEAVPACSEQGLHVDLDLPYRFGDALGGNGRARARASRGLPRLWRNRIPACGPSLYLCRSIRTDRRCPLRVGQSSDVSGQCNERAEVQRPILVVAEGATATVLERRPSMDQRGKSCALVTRTIRSPG